MTRQIDIRYRVVFDDGTVYESTKPLEEAIKTLLKYQSEGKHFDFRILEVIL